MGAVGRENRPEVLKVEDILQLAALTLHLCLIFLGLGQFLKSHAFVRARPFEILFFLGAVAAAAHMDLDTEFTPARLVAVGAPELGVPVVVVVAIGFEKFRDVVGHDVLPGFPRVMLLAIASPLNQKFAVANSALHLQDFVDDVASIDANGISLRDTVLHVPYGTPCCSRHSCT